jgi:PTS system fructose-specific IIC component
MPVVVIPLLSLFISAGLFITLLGRPIAALMKGLNGWLEGMSGGSALVLGLILGAMMGFDLGGPVNKTAYFFATAGLAGAGTATDSPQLKIMARSWLPAWSPSCDGLPRPCARPLHRAGARNGKAARLLGASFISEG